MVATRASKLVHVRDHANVGVVSSSEPSVSPLNRLGDAAMLEKDGKVLQNPQFVQ